ncbi:SDR family NAD(P)-dependent oxidoreductase [Candidatus Gottesmanbacteria bacterium]|nr:SDR family NAD(P)-dependent oxidoreductase [Candidatus Gottesmanbacteria bacterium]
MKFKNKTVIVTGASTGIGRSTALAFAKEGAFVILAARTIDRLLETKKQIGGGFL